MPPALRVLVVHSGVPRTLESSPYAQRRAEGEAVAAAVGVRVLRDATPEQVRDHPRGRHAVSEMRRVLDFADALMRADVDALGPLMLASHASLRDDMQVSTPELDTLVDCLVDAGAIGARLTGGGFGGCVVALVPWERAEAIARDAASRYEDATGREPVAMVVRAAPAAGALEMSPKSNASGSDRPVTER
jgi:galactokinase